MDQDKIVYISSIVFDTKFMLHEEIKVVKVDICKKLTRQVAQGESMCSVCRLHTFMIRKLFAQSWDTGIAIDTIVLENTLMD